jgi:hypothetical protein
VWQNNTLGIRYGRRCLGKNRFINRPVALNSLLERPREARQGQL